MNILVSVLGHMCARSFCSLMETTFRHMKLEVLLGIQMEGQIAVDMFGWPAWVTVSYMVGGPPLYTHKSTGAHLLHRYRHDDSAQLQGQL